MTYKQHNLKIFSVKGKTAYKKVCT